MKKSMSTILVFLGLVLAAGSVGLAQEQVTLQINVPMLPQSPSAPVMEHYLDLYQELNPHVVIENLGREHDTSKLITMYVSGTMPDIVSLDTFYLNGFYREGIILGVPSALQARMEQELFPVVVQSLMVDGRMIGTPHENMLLGLWYNRQTMAESGIAEPPRSWQEFEAFGRRMARQDAAGALQSPGAVVGAASYEVEHLIQAMYRSNGGRFLDENGQLALDNSMIDVIERLLGWEGHSGSVPFVRLGGEGSFFDGEAGFMTGYPWHLQGIQDNYTGNYHQDIASAPLPSGSAGRSSTQYGHGFAVSSTSEHPDEAWKLLEWLTLSVHEGTTPMGHVMTILGSVPIHRADVSSPYVRENWSVMEGFVTSLDFATNAFDYMFRGVRTETPAYYFGDLALRVRNDEVTTPQGFANLFSQIEAFMAK